MQPLDLDAVQAFVLTADLRSFTRAAAAMATSQAAVSLKIKRLETRLGRRLIERTPRLVRLSSDGTVFLDLARDLLTAHQRALRGLEQAPERLRIGISDHVAGPDLPDILQHVGAHDPATILEVRIGHSRDLLTAFEARELDLVILRHQDGEPPGEALRRDKLAWFAGPQFAGRDTAMLPLATLSASCGVRETALGALDNAGIAWREAFVGGGLAAVVAAVAAGLAVAPLPVRLAPPRSRDVTDLLGLPKLPDFDVVLHARSREIRSRAGVARLSAAFRF